MFLSVNVFSTKVLIEDTFFTSSSGSRSGNGTAILRSLFSSGVPVVVAC